MGMDLDAPGKGYSLVTLCKDLGWTATGLSKHAVINAVTANRALKGLTIKPVSAKKIADALSKAYGEPIRIRDLADLNVVYEYGTEEKHPE